MHTSHFLHRLGSTFRLRVCRTAFVGLSEAFGVNLLWDKSLKKTKSLIRYTVVSFWKGQSRVLLSGDVVKSFF